MQEVCAAQGEPLRLGLKDVERRIGEIEVKPPQVGTSDQAIDALRREQKKLHDYLLASMKPRENLTDEVRQLRADYNALLEEPSPSRAQVPEQAPKHKPTIPQSFSRRSSTQRVRSSQP